MLFKNLAPLIARGVTVQFTVLAAADGKLEVNVIPTTEGGSTGLNLVSKSFVATPDELDLEFPEVIAGYSTANLSLKQQLEDVKTVAEAAAKEASEAAARKSTSAPAKPGVARAANSKPAGKTEPTLLEEEEEEASGSEDLATGGDGTSNAGGEASQSQTLPLEL